MKKPTTTVAMMIWEKRRCDRAVSVGSAVGVVMREA
jgi:hypothetical protein